MPTQDFTQHLQKPPTAKVFPVSKLKLRQIFATHSDVTRLFPSGVLLRDSQSFAVGSDVISNVDLIATDRLTCMLASRDTQYDVTALSFGTTVPCGQSGHLLRHCVDYYGSKSSDVIHSHVLQHLHELKLQLNAHADCTHVTCHLYAPADVMTSSVRASTFDLVCGVLGSGEYTDRTRCVLQCAVDIPEDPRSLGVNPNKL